MHYRLFITFKDEEIKTSKEARDYVYKKLESDNSFVGEGGLFGGPVADWFVIGGRWSGELQKELLDKNFYDAVKEELKLGSEYGMSTKEIEDNREAIQKLWEKIGGKDLNPFSRDTYNHFGYEDDAAIITDKIYEKLLADYEGKEKGGRRWGDDQEYFDLAFADLDYDEVKKEDFIGKKWIVVVDYHS